jgi:hypothetical protein
LAFIAILLVILEPFAVETLAAHPGGSGRTFAAPGGGTVAVSPEGGVVEVVPERYRKRYLRWKAEYLSTEAGRRQWEAYTRRADFMLFIVVSKGLGRSAEAGRYVWDDSGSLVGATILLGPQIETGYPSKPDYPVMCTLSPGNLPGDARGEILAAAKLAHEFGHVNYTATQDAGLFRLQDELIPEYNRIFKANGFNADDERLAELSRRMKGTPSEISREREYQAEANVVAYLKERFSGDGEYGAMPQAIREAIESYYQGSIELR